MSRPLVFLDFDGVLNNMQTHGGWRPGRERRVPVEAPAVDLITNFLEAVNGRLVISSTWRKIKTRNDILWQFPQWRPYLEPQWRTGSLDSGFRGDEVDAWLQENEVVAPYVCFDDDSDFHAHNNLIQTDPEVGLQKQDVEKALDVLNAQRSQQILGTGH